MSLVPVVVDQAWQNGAFDGRSLIAHYGPHVAQGAVVLACLKTKAVVHRLWMVYPDVAAAASVRW